jgi:hypothetical protein
MKKFAPFLLTLSSIQLGSCSPTPMPVAVDLMCTETSRYHTTDEQREAAKRDPSTWFGLFQWLASFDVVRDKRCSS